MKKQEPVPTDLPAEPAQHTPTPDNTPVPGGGSWRWDIALPGWAENTATPQPTDSFKE
jgi:hypothetical protein